ncbi:MAG: histidine kinase [Rhodothermales bacterium]|nr:histidine kinase [Rhodothermales bacterium]MBO6779916.1 histidine kinase [Rhodothermales bacterium]
MPRLDRIVPLIALSAVLLALVEPARVAYDWWEFRGYMKDMGQLMPVRVGSAESFDWVIWDDSDGQIEARYVFPGSPAAESGLQPGDRFYMLDNTQYFSADDLRDAVRGARPGRVLTYMVAREGDYEVIQVTATRYPTFLYPRSGALWQFALWGFAIGAFFHILALFIAAPLARRSGAARAEFVLIAVSAVWIVSNLIRLLAVETAGPPAAGSFYDRLFQGLTLIGLVGWIGFPVLLIKDVLRGVLQKVPRWTELVVMVPPVLLALAIGYITFVGHLGPVTMESLLVPILVFASCYIGAAALSVIVAFRLRPSSELEEGGFGGWGLVGSTAILTVAVVAALCVQEFVPALNQIGEVRAGWLIVFAQLLAVAPVTMLSYGTLRHGKIDDVLSRAFVYALVLGLIFFAFVAGSALLDRYVGGPSQILSGLLVVVLLLVFDRLIRRLRIVAETVFRTERQRTRQLVVRLQERMPDTLDADVLLQDVVAAAGRGLGARSAVMFVRLEEPTPRWRSASHHPEPPYLTERDFQRIWPYFENDSRVWARNPELDSRHLPAELARDLVARGGALAVPIRSEGRSRGLLVLGLKKARTTVYNLEDVDVLRALAAHLAVAIDRIDLVERERRLARETTQAQLVALRSQINPHFLFNALNTILSHIAEKPETAEAAVEHLAAIFRHTLNAEDLAFVSLREEFELVGHYLAIEKARFGKNLDVSTEIESGLEQTPVPAFCVQTLVENSVKHGIERRRGGGKLEVRAYATADGVAVRVTDTGVGIPQLFGRPEPTSAREDFFGIGLKNVHTRMELLYHRADLLLMESDPVTGTTATLVLPETGESGSGQARALTQEPITT